MTKIKCEKCKSLKNKQIADKKTYKVFKCLDCGLVFTDFKWSNKFAKQIYTDEYYKGWGILDEQDKKTISALKRSTFNRYLKMLPRITKKHPKILDVGCATGFLLEEAKELGYDPYGVEISDYSSKVAQDKFGKTKVFCGSLEESKFEKSSFDVIVMSDLIEHVSDPLKLLKSAYGYLRPNGQILIITPNIESLLKKVMGKYYVNYKEEHLFYFNKKTLSEILNDADMDILTVKYAKKALNLNYLIGHFKAYPVPLLTPIFKILSIIPSRFRKAKLLIPSGDIIILAQKK